MKRAAAPLLVAALTFASCSGPSLNPSVPASMVPSTPSMSSVQSLTRGRVHAVRIPQSEFELAKHSPRGKAILMLKVPPKPKPARGMHPHYISYHTASIAVTVDGGSPQIFDISLENKACYYPASSGAQPRQIVGGYFCKFVVQATYGAHIFSFATYDRPQAQGNELSANASVPFDVKKGSTDTLGVTLGGVPGGFGFTQPSNSRFLPNADGSITIGGNLAFSILAWPTDADGGAIIGPGAATLNLSFSKGAKATIVPINTLSKPRGVPNGLFNQYGQQYQISGKYHPSNPTVPNQFTLDVLLTPPASTGTDPLSFSIPVNLYYTWIYWATQSGNTVGTSDQFGNTIATSGAWPVPDPSGVTFDPDNNWIYIPSIDDNSVCVYDLQGNLISSASGNWSQLSNPTDIVYVKVGNQGRLYVANSGAGSSEGVGITAYKANGTRIALSGSFSGLYSPRSIAYNSHNQHLYVTDNEMGQIFEFDLNGNQIGAYTPPISTFSGIAFVPGYYNYVYIPDPKGNVMYVMDESGNFYNYTFPNLNQANGLAYDPTSGFIYVTNGGDDTIRVYTQYGAEQSWSGYSAGASGSNPWGITAVW